MRRFCLPAVLALGAILARAQDSSQWSKNEVAGTFGHTFISDQNVPNSGLPNSIITHGAGYSFEVNYARILFAADWVDVSAEVPAIFNPDEKLHYEANAIPRSYSSIFVTPSARLRLVPDVAFSPWVSFGGGFGHFEASDALVFSGPNTANRGLTTGVLQIGAGLDVRIPCPRISRLRIRVEVRDDWSDVPPLNVDTGKTRQHNYYVAGGIVYRF